MKSIPKRRFERYKHIKRRKELLKSICPTKMEKENDPDGKFANNNIANEYVHRGRNTKTNRKKGKTSFKSKQGQYGVGKNWSPHDQRQLDDMKEQIKEED